ncbi:RWD domain-containing protein 1 [Bagarius yarrelli]|uniref:RWD domain-containing protein 1 n=1 Tax=Bagarius yarrelli TaxID=175774 RepID=A0A556U6F2_BAGYA|nr:RWD domain-containing protein 1 [Bagarius yarrelli]
MSFSGYGAPGGGYPGGRDMSGSMGFPEFKELWAVLNGWKQHFMSIDRDMSGTVDPQEMNQAVTSMGYRLSPQAMNCIIKRYSTQGKISFDDYVACCIKLRTLTVLCEEPISFTITVSSDAGESDDMLQVTLKFTYVENYPDEVPLWEIQSQENLEDRDVEDILSLLQQQNLGMVMIFTLVTAVQERLNEVIDQMKIRKEEEKERREKEAEEAEKKEFQGTVVTIENFLAWKAQFEKEMAELKRKKQKEDEQAGKNKLTGKQLFEKDRNLDTSDIQFLEESGNSVEVDESLFQDMDDLELDEDDPDFDPLDLGSDDD